MFMYPARICQEYATKTHFGIKFLNIKVRRGGQSEKHHISIVLMSDVTKKTDIKVWFWKSNNIFSSIS